MKRDNEDEWGDDGAVKRALYKKMKQRRARDRRQRRKLVKDGDTWPELMLQCVSRENGHEV